MLGNEEKRDFLKKTILESKKFDTYMKSITVEGTFYVDVNSQLDYWIREFFIYYQVKITECENSDYIICEDFVKYEKCSSKIYRKFRTFLELINQGIETTGLMNCYFSFWSNNNLIISKYAEDDFIIPALDFMITEKCSLKCQDCLNLMQYYKNPINYNLQELKESIDALNLIFDKILELRILGGEPFVSRDIYEICRYSSQKDTIKKIVIFSNATIIPDKKELMQIPRDKLLFYLSDYGHPNQKIETIINVLEECGFMYCVYNFSGDQWIKHSSFENNGLDKAQVDDLFKKCEGRVCPTILRNRFYACEFLANASNLAAIPDFDFDYVELCGHTEKVRCAIREYLEASNAYPGCYFCSRLILDKKEYVKAAVQCQFALPYEEYC